MTQEQDIVKRLLETVRLLKECGFYQPSVDAVSQAAQTIAALRAERDEALERIAHKDECIEEWKRLHHNDSTIVSSQRTALDIAIHERDDARKALEPFARAADGVGTVYGDDFKLDRREVVHAAILITVGDLRRARSASSNREGGE